MECVSYSLSIACPSWPSSVASCWRFAQLAQVESAVWSETSISFRLLDNDTVVLCCKIRTSIGVVMGLVVTHGQGILGLVEARGEVNETPA